MIKLNWKLFLSVLNFQRIRNLFHLSKLETLKRIINIYSALRRSLEITDLGEI